MKKALFCILLTAISLLLNAQNVGINTTSPDNSAALDVVSTSKGMLVPRMTEAQRTAITSPAKGLLVFQTNNTEGFYFHNGTAWQYLDVPTKIQDADSNTKIEVEKTANDNQISFSLDGTEYFKMNKGSLEVLNTGGSVFMGKEAGLDEIYGAGSRNVGIGFQTLKATQGSFNNVAVGARALWSQADGGDNVAVGTDALRSNNNYFNTAIGSYAGAENTGSGNVFIGHHAGENETGSNKLYIANSNTTTPLIWGDFNAKQLKINGSLNVNNAYTLPSVVGNAGQYLQTNGSGTAIWATLPTYLTTETDPKIGSLTTNYLSKWNGSTLANTQLFDNGTNIGIGTTTPSVKFDVAGTVRGTSLISNGSITVDAVEANNGTNFNTLTFGTSSGEGIGSPRTMGSPNRYGLDFYTQHDVQMSITHDGNVGIGTNTPKNKLDVSGGLAVGYNYAGVETAPDDGAIFEGNVSIGTPNALLPLTVSGNTHEMVGILSNSINGTEIQLYNSSTGGKNWIFNSSGSATTGGAGHLLIKDENQNTRLMIKSDGNVGIGTTAPNFKLDVKGSFWADNMYTNNIYPDNIGATTTSTENLTVNANAYIEALEVTNETTTNTFKMTAGASNGFVLKSDATGNASWVNPSSVETDPKVGSLTTNYLSKWNGSTLANTQVFDNGTNVGIGTTTPSVKLDVNGTVKASRLQIPTDAVYGYVLRSDANGNGYWSNPNFLTTTLQDADANTSVQVEKTVNDDKIRFTVGGVERFSMTGARFDVQSTGASTFFGASAGANDDLTNNQNTFIGYYVGNQTTTGENNSAMGRSALELNTTGSRNTALGYVALSNLTTGTGNTAVGAFAGQNATGSDNVFIGYGAGSNETGNGKLYIDNNGTASPLIYGDFAANILTINGKLGVGTTTPTQAKFVVNGNASNTLSYGYLNSSGNTGTISNSTNNYSIYASDRIAATEFNAFSDRRIKHILRGSNSSDDLTTLMKLKITDYKLIDTIAKGNRTFKKVIAQEVAEVYPNAVNTMTDFIPNIYQLTKIENGFVALTNHGLVVGDKVKLIFGESQNVYKVLKINENGFYTEGVSDGSVFVYGKEVSDFHTVDYEALSTLNISATQELVKQINELKARNNQLETKNNRLEGELGQLKTDVNEIKRLLQKEN
jgi:hypothetical protein